MKSILISINPKWCELIASGKKTIEVRKTRPRCETPFKCYIYCTKPKERLLRVYGKKDYEGYPFASKMKDDEKVFIKTFADSEDISRLHFCGKVIGEFVCEQLDEYRAEFTDLHIFNSLNKDVCQNTICQVIGDINTEDDEEKYYFVSSNELENPNDNLLCKYSCLTFDEIRKYVGKTFYDKSFYGYHISDLVIYDKPKELKEFVRYQNCPYGADKCETCDKHPCLTRPPQSWCYCEELNT